MAKIILEFDSIEESNEARVALDASRWKSVIWNLDQRLRSITKYGTSIHGRDREASEDEINIAEKIREEIRDLLDEYTLSLED